MMQQYFIAPQDIQSPRWQLAFSNACFFTTCVDIPAILNEAICWCHESTIDQATLKQLVVRGAKVVILVNAEQPESAKFWLEQGAHGYLHYGAAVELLQSVSQVVALGGIWMGAELLRAIVQSVYSIKADLPATNTPSVDLAPLSQRELEVAKLVSQGRSNKEIARFLDISERTVKAHLSAVFEKLNVRDRLHLALVMPKS